MGSLPKFQTKRISKFKGAATMRVTLGGSTSPNRDPLDGISALTALVRDRRMESSV